MEGDLVAVIQADAVVDGTSDLLMVDVFTEGPADQNREDWVALVRDHPCPVPRRASDSEISAAIGALLVELTAIADGTSQQKTRLSSGLVGQDIRL